MKKLITYVLIVSLLLNVSLISVNFSDNKVYALENNNNILRIDGQTEKYFRDFVLRLYKLCFNRTPVDAEVNYHVNELIKGTSKAGNITFNFFNSPEFLNKNINDDNYVKLCYQVLMNRNGDKEGIEYWKNNLLNGVSRNYVLDKFIKSLEFNNICKEYKIETGATLSEPRDQNIGISSFISRCYSKVLSRRYENDGMNYYANIILNSENKKDTAISIAVNNFFHSPEFLNKNAGNEEFIKIAYRTFLNREAEPEGLKYYLNQLNNNVSRDTILNNFGASPEFSDLMRSYGIYSIENGFALENGKYYYYVNGNKQKGYKEINGNTYYFNTSTGAFEFVNNEKWIDGMKLNMLDSSKFNWVNGIPYYKNSQLGIDVSSHQGSIDWNKVKNDGVEFVILRVGFRGYGPSGLLRNDARFEEYYAGAKSVGLPVGVYFFSQAINEQEAIEEANLMLQATNGKQIDLGYVYDLEDITYDGARTDNMSASQWTRNAVAFLNTIKAAGKKGIIYTNMSWYREKYYIDKLYEWDIWLAQYGTKTPSLPYEFKIWQFSDKGRIDGINTKVDMNVKFN